MNPVHLRRRPFAAVTALAGFVAVATISAPSTSSAELPRAAAPAGFELVAPLEVIGAAPVDVAVRAGDPTLYVVSSAGQVTRWDGAVAAPVADLSDLITFGGEQGLLGLAFSADGSRAYVNYTDTAGSTVVAELPVVDDGASVTLDPAGLRTLLTIEQPYPNHNGGDILVGPDGMLYIPTGDGGAGSDPERRAQDLGSLLGKIVRIDPTPDAAAGTEYTIPADNPYVGVEGARGEIWSVGLRNPWRVSFDATTGDLWIADVGQGVIEEIDLAPAAPDAPAGRGLNFGWSAFEGDDVHNSDVVVADADHTGPVFTYDHSDGRCSVSGGVRVRGSSALALEGNYVFADYCTGEVWTLPVTGDGAAAVVGEPKIMAGPAQPTSVTQGPDGTVYVTAQLGLFRFDPS